jgi:hypothetical protein
MWKNLVQPGMRQMTIWRMRITCWVPGATHTHTHTHTLRIHKSYCFSTATMVSRTHPIVTLYVHCISSYLTSFIGMQESAVLLLLLCRCNLLVPNVTVVPLHFSELLRRYQMENMVTLSFDIICSIKMVLIVQYNYE